MAKIETISILGVDYQISDAGEVSAPVGIYPFITYVPRRAASTSNGRKYYNFRGENGEQRNAYLHYLVAQCHVPNPKGYVHVRPLDGDWANCSADNLAWCETRYSVSPGRLGHTKIKDADAAVIRAMVEGGISQREVADYYKVSPSLICRIVGGTRGRTA